MNDLRNVRIGNLVGIGIHSRSRNGHIRWECQCDCGQKHTVNQSHLKQGLVTHCGCQTYSGVKQPQWNGCGDISGGLWYEIYKKSGRAKSRQELPFEITIEYAWQLFLNQNRCCALSNEPIHFPHDHGIKVRSSRTASLDRIDSSKGYVEGNVQWIHKDINLMKNRLDQDLFIHWCNKISHFSGAGGACEISF